MKMIGVLGGLGPQATMDFEQRMHAAARRIIPQQQNAGYPPMIVYYHRRPPVVMNADNTPVVPFRLDPLLLDAAKRLGAWADFLVLLTNSVHLFQGEIEQAAKRPLLSMIEQTVREVKRRGLRNIGVLGLGEPRVYFEPLAQIGVRYEIIDGDLRGRLDQAIFVVDEGRAHEVGHVAREAVAVLRERGVDAVIMGCTEIPFLLPEAANDPFFINPIEYLVEAAVRRAMD